MSSTDSPPLPARDRILQVAGRLFHAEGYRAIGIDRVIAEADVAKATFYKHFPSKDDLIAAWIALSEQRTVPHLPPEEGPEPLTAYVRYMLKIARLPNCHGCAYQGTAAEFPDRGHPAHAASLGVKIRVLTTLVARARAEGVRDPETTAQQIFLLLEGVWASVRMFGPSAPLDHVEAAVARLIK